MNILIIGNGFDLAHGLPTKYSDYVDQIAEHQGIYEYLWETQGADNEKTVLYNRIRKSVLFKYIEQQREAGWVDFENELRRIIEGICELENCLAKHSKKNEDGSYTERLYLKKGTLTECSLFLKMVLYEGGRGPWTQSGFDELEKDVLSQAMDFVELFKEYIVWVTKTKIPEVKKKQYFENFKVDFFLSFNYTTTLFKAYQKQINADKFCFVHGMIDENPDSKIVMGVGSDFYNEEKHEKFLECFKFFQRYQYKSETSLNYLQWIDYFRNQNVDDLDEDENRLQIHIYGHSLDLTDKDILLPFFELKNANVWIYYYDKNSKLSLKKNLVRILGRKKFCEYMLCENPKVIFRRIVEQGDFYKLED